MRKLNTKTANVDVAEEADVVNLKGLIQKFSRVVAVIRRFLRPTGAPLNNEAEEDLDCCRLYKLEINI